MKTTFFIAAATAFTTVSSLAIPPAKRDGGSISITPHDSYGSSIGVLGCKINVNRVAYWPMQPSCDGMCMKVSANGRSTTLLQIDTSGGAYDISYEAWNILKTGQSATTDPVEGGGFAATYERVDMSQCADIITESSGKLAFTAANSMNYIAGCPANSWVGRNYALYNIANSVCSLGVDERCTLDMSVSNQPSCPSGLGSQKPLAGDQVMNIIYGTGAKQVAA
ncbi:hypothetical protein LTR09_007793 [Extremus antarcticus]|uniref:Cerato-platanin n=1 Tax=Extremus antarcticus TaxID=702011 RepID=A0AAJ0G7F8_9PEZI|nr:hypothetical protein LTR09_007793 [Extremus antarcticus]